MPLSAAAKTAVTLAKDFAKSDVARDLAASAAGGATQKLLQRYEEGRPAARTKSADSGAEQPMAPRRQTLPHTSARMSAPPDLTGMGAPDHAARFDAPPTYEQAMSHGGAKAHPWGRMSGPPDLPAFTTKPQAMPDLDSKAAGAAHRPASPHGGPALNPDALPFMNEKGEWVSAHDPSNPANQRMDSPPPYTPHAGQQAAPQHPGQPAARPFNPDALPFMNEKGEWVGAKDAANPAHQRPARTSVPTASPGRGDAAAASSAPTHRPAPTADAQGFRASFKKTLRTFFGGGAAAVAQAAARPQPNRISTIGGHYNGQPIELRLSRKDTSSYQQQHGIPDKAFDVLQYLAFEQARHDPLRSGAVKVQVNGQAVSLAQIDINEILFDREGAARQATAS